MPLEQLNFQKINEFDLIESKSFDYDDFLYDKIDTTNQKLNRMAPKKATHISIAQSFCEPIIIYDHSSKNGVKRTCIINYWARKVA